MEPACDPSYLGLREVDHSFKACLNYRVESLSGILVRACLKTESEKRVWVSHKVVESVSLCETWGKDPGLEHARQVLYHCAIPTPTPLPPVPQEVKLQSVRQEKQSRGFRKPPDPHGTNSVQTAPGTVCSLQRHPAAEGGCLSGLAGLDVGRHDHQAFSGGKDESRMGRENLSLKEETVFRPVLWSHPLTPLFLTLQQVTG